MTDMQFLARFALSKVPSWASRVHHGIGGVSLFIAAVRARKLNLLEQSNDLRNIGGDRHFGDSHVAAAACR